MTSHNSHGGSDKVALASHGWSLQETRQLSKELTLYSVVQKRKGNRQTLAGRPSGRPSYRADEKRPANGAACNPFHAKASIRRIERRQKMLDPEAMSKLRASARSWRVPQSLEEGKKARKGK